MADIVDDFDSAAAHLRTIISTTNEDDLLYLYARYKQATEGKCTAAKPSFWELEKKKKWNAWKDLESMERLQAMQEYVEKIKNIDPNFTEDSTEASNTFTVKMSQPVMDDDEGDEDDGEFSQVFDYCKLGNVAKLKSEKNNLNLNTIKDSGGRNLLHWACDRGNYDVAEFLIKDCHLDVNEQDDEMLTALHYAVQCEQDTIIKLLLKHGGNINIPDIDGETPLNCASKRIKAILIEE